ncbi:MAG: class I SAM-dependent methyltransferase [Pseudomonadota bacterium]|nr:class I SAM-dependent methyltransferase [Pseudomonadota bacterium]
MSAETSNLDWNTRAHQWVRRAPEGAPNEAAREINNNLIECAGIRPGDHVLDMASGTGEPSLSVAEIVGEEGSVVATDATEAMLVIAERRATNMGLANFSIHVTPMEELPFEDNRFDAATCRFGLMHADDPVAGLGQTRRVLKSGGRAAFAVHGPRTQGSQWWLVYDVAKEYFQKGADARAARRQLYSGEGEAGTLFAEAGFKNIEEKMFANLARHPIPADRGGPGVWRPMLERGFSHLLADLDESQLVAIDNCLEAAFAPFRDGNDYVLSAAQRITSGVK